MGTLVHTCLGSSYLIAHTHSFIIGPAVINTHRYCRNKHTHTVDQAGSAVTPSSVVADGCGRVLCCRGGRRGRRARPTPLSPTPKWDTLGRAQNRLSAVMFGCEAFGLSAVIIENRNGISPFWVAQVLPLVRFGPICGTATLTQFCHAIELNLSQRP